ncbi:MAG TPA: pyridoxamine 5'-phosphate oxidase family protein [Gemmatimonadales bacterium]|nr:pyridoxamine 5'-phosphate oxidase family protein [Gemmatimonadales bacterium]
MSAPSQRSRIRRLPKRARYDRETIHGILDQGSVAHVGFVADGAPVVVPMAYARLGDRLVLHGARAGRLAEVLGGGAPVCVTVTILDGLVLARSAFHHSMNYRSVVVLGAARPIRGAAAKGRALRALSEHLVPGRWDDVREPTPRELAATALFELPLDEAAAKIRTGPPVDAPGDYGRRTWAGVIPLALCPGAPEPDPRLAAGIGLPGYLRLLPDCWGIARSASARRRTAPGMSPDGTAA